jgi:hypothetical protein
MRKLLEVIAMLCLTITASAQNVPERAKNEISPTGWAYLYNVNGEPFSVTKFAKVVEGSPFFKEEWIRGTVVTNSGIEYGNVPLRLNLLENKIHFQDDKEQEMIANTPIWEVKLTDSSSGITYSFVHSAYLGRAKNSELRCWLLILQTGHIGLYKQFYKTVSESRPYGAATTEQRIKTVARYYVLKDSEIKPAKKWQNLLDLFSDRKADIQEYINKNQLKGKSESDFVSLVKFYNELTW